jgi:hypothetical protein
MSVYVSKGQTRGYEMSKSSNNWRILRRMLLENAIFKKESEALGKRIKVCSSYARRVTTKCYSSGKWIISRSNP